MSRISQSLSDLDKAAKETLFSQILVAMAKVQWPKEEDLIGAIHGLLRAQSFYYLSAVDIAR